MVNSLLYSLFFSLLISSGSIAQIDSTLTSTELEVIESYKLLLADKVTNNLLANHKKYLESPSEYWNFLNENFLCNWDFDTTTKALIGSDIFNSLSLLQFKELSRALETTFVRYAFESLSFYSQQRLNVIDIKLNEQQTLAWLRVNMESTSLPDIHLDLLLKRRDGVRWKGIDFRFKGMTYVNLKKNSYRKGFEDLKFQGLLRKLDDKNKVFFKELCQRDTNYIDAKKPPCLQNYDKK